MAMIIRVCEYCGKSYRTHDSIRKHYCSQACSSLGRRQGTTGTCPVCAKTFYRHPSKESQEYCSISCAITARNRTNLNPSYHRDITGEKNPMHGVQRFGSDNPMYGKRKEQTYQWKGGRRSRKDGYTYVIVPDNYPYPAYQKKSGTKYALEHRVIMEQHLGRYLKPEEVIHHIDGNPQNNDLGNLQLFASQSEHISIGHATRK